MPHRAAMAAAAFATAAALAGCAAFPFPRADPSPAGAPPDRTIIADSFSSQTVRYRCQGGTELEVVYLNLNNDTALAALHFDGRTALLQNRPTASGAHYIALDEQHSLRWRTRGSEGQLSFLAADHTARERTLLADCRAVR